MQRITPARLYPETAPRQEYRIKVSERHTLYVASYGNEHGLPVVALHGGPGSGTTPYFAQMFNPLDYNLILIDQRGAGLSTPKGEMRENTTALLIEDIETVRQFFQFEAWAVFGGSWGSTLSLLYAEAHPSRVTALFLRGIFLARKDDVTAFVRDGSPAALLHQKEWADFKAATTQLIAKAERSDLSVAVQSIYHIYYELLQHPDPAFREWAGSTLSGWERFNSYLVPDPEYLKPENNRDGSNTGLTEATYFENDCFIQPNQILHDIARLQNIPVYIVQGIYDLVCPSYMADELEVALLAVNTDKSLIVRRNCLAGHSQKDAAIADALVESLDAWAAKCKKKECPVNEAGVATRMKMF